VLALTIKTKEKESAPKPVTLMPLLLLFKKVKGLNIKMLRSLFLFKSKVLKTKKEDLKSDKSILLEDIYIANSL